MKKEKVKLMIHGHPFEFSYEEIMGEDGEGGEFPILGKCNIFHSYIKVRPDMSKELQQSTFLHELTHVITEVMSVQLPENAIDLVALGIHEFIKDNKKFFKKMYDL